MPGTSSGSRGAILASLGVGVALAALVLVASGGRSEAASALPAGLTAPVVAGAGLLDGFNPCSFAGLIVFTSFAMAAAQRVSDRGSPSASAPQGRRRLMAGGFTYVSAIFLIYVVLGLGFLAAVNVLSSSHVVGKIAALVTAGLGLWTLKDALFPESPWRLETPKFLSPLVRQSFQATALPAIFGAGIVVGLCTVPCTGGIYLGILSLISAQPTYGIGVAYLFLYNVMFITPLLAVLGVASNRRALALLARWHGENRFRIRLALGAAMILLGLLSLAVLT